MVGNWDSFHYIFFKCYLFVQVMCYVLFMVDQRSKEQQHVPCFSTVLPQYYVHNTSKLAPCKIQLCPV